MDNVSSLECLKLDSQSEVLDKDFGRKDLFSPTMVPLNCDTPTIDINVEEPKITELIDEDEELMDEDEDEDEELMDEEQINEIKTSLILHWGPPSLANKVARSAPAPASLETVQELAKETGSSEEQNQAQNGLDDALKRRLQKLFDSNRVMLFMKGTPEEPKCKFSRMAVTLLKYFEVEFGSFDLLTDNEVMEGIQKYSNWPHLPQIYFEGRARGFRHIETLMKGCPSECSKDAFE